MNAKWLNLHPGTVTHPGMWDDTFLQELLAGVHGPVLPGNVTVIPGRYHTNDIDQINQTLRHSPTLAVVTADEASELPADLLHPDTPVWCQTLRPGRFERGVTPFPLGYPPDTRQIIAEQGYPPPDKDLWWWFSGQNTHARRQECINGLTNVPGGTVNETAGFTQGFERRTYLEMLSRAKVAPCPSGPETQDTFRLWEAVVAGAIPLADASTPTRIDDGYWQALCPDAPFPIIRDWSTVGPVIEELVAGWPHTANRVGAWWSRYRRQWARRLEHTMIDLGALPRSDPEAQVTCVIPTSPIPSHPDTRFIEEVVESVRERWPTVDIRIMVDGVRPEQWTETGNYQEYTRRLLWLAEHRWWNVTVTVHDAHMHQAAMLSHELATIDTPLVLFVEHDTPLMNEWPIADLVAAATDPQVDLLRLNHEHQIHPEHVHLLADDQPSQIAGLTMRKTRQWSQRPHLAKTVRYREWLAEWFAPTERSMIEDRMHSVVQRFSWGRHRIWLWTPEGNHQRSWHSDAREGGIKWPNS